MKIGREMAVQRHLGPLFEGQSVAGLGEGQLLDRFIERRDGPAFAALVARHGPMVLGVCRRLLADPLDVEDAFQATFLVLVRRAGSLRERDRLAPWLFGVARKVATRARADVARRRARERPGIESIASLSGLDDPDRELGRALIEEIDRLPAALREPILLCCVEGLSYDEAAGRLRSTAPAIRGRLARARGRLKDRLTRRGFAPTVGGLGVLLSFETASAAVPLRLLTTTIQVAKAGAFPAGVDILAEGVIRTMILTKSKILAATMVACGIAGSSLGLRAQTPSSPDPAKTAEADRLDQVEKKLDRVLQALEGQANRAMNSTVETRNTAKVARPVTPVPTAAPVGLDPAARSLIEGLTKGADLKDGNLSVQVFSGAEGLDKLDPATRALIEAAMKGADLKDLKGNAEVVQEDGKTMIIVPGKLTIEKRPPSPQPPASPLTPAAPVNARLDALESRFKRLEARLDDLERRNGLAPRSERIYEETTPPPATKAVRRSQRLLTIEPDQKAEASSPTTSRPAADPARSSSKVD